MYMEQAVTFPLIRPRQPIESTLDRIQPPRLTLGVKARANTDPSARFAFRPGIGADIR